MGVIMWSLIVINIALVAALPTELPSEDVIHHVRHGLQHHQEGVHWPRPDRRGGQEVRQVRRCRLQGRGGPEDPRQPGNLRRLRGAAEAVRQKPERHHDAGSWTTSCATSETRSPRRMCRRCLLRSATPRMRTACSPTCPSSTGSPARPKNPTKLQSQASKRPWQHGTLLKKI